MPPLDAQFEDPSKVKLIQVSVFVVLFGSVPTTIPEPFACSADTVDNVLRYTTFVPISTLVLSIEVTVPLTCTDP